MPKSFWITLAIVLVAVTFVPLIPNDTPILCDESAGVSKSCDDGAGYISIYTKFLQ